MGLGFGFTLAALVVSLPTPAPAGDQAPSAGVQVIGVPGTDAIVAIRP